ncbi:protein AATF-like [Linepithema humile]|uniref:protein AATF-like n=1 Tax=Linepithema humile TaxID=83485 RepID=UPI0006237B4E|nr:PREDICTED: protein AATF-like [Linepithema humile]
MARKSFADKINDLLTTKPDLVSDEEPEETKAKIVERYDESGASDDEFRQSKIRRQNVDTLDKVDERYAGRKVSRKDIYSDEDDNMSESVESNNSEEDEEDEEIESTLEQDEDKSDSNEESELEQESEEADSVSEEEDEYSMDISNSLHKQSDSAIKTMSETNVRTEVEKGNCIRNQLKIWENLSEMRIKLQKCIVTSNQMPQYDTHKELRSHADFVKKISESKSKLMLLVNNMLELKDLLLKQYPETRNLCASAKKRKADNEENADDPMDEEIPSDTEDELEDGEEPSVGKDKEAAKESAPRKRLKYNETEKVLQENHDSYKEYRNSVIKKWNDKTRIATGSLNKNSGQSTLKQIEFAMSDMSKLRKRTQLKRSEYSIVGKSSSTEDDDGRRVQEYDPEIYDDNDFYHQLLKDLIEYKSSDVTDPIQLSKQMIRLQNMRTKMKRKIDTRATKGRRVRYNVHTKLVNFMAPITVYDTWTDSAKNELYSSLFGKIKPIEEQIKYL